MITDVASYAGAGIILTQPQTQTTQTRHLLLRGTDTKIWSFSKGRPEAEDRETPLRTAVRETFEETGLTHGKEYTIVGSSIRFGKRPYWLGVVKDNDTKIRLNPKEHCAYGWFTWAEIETLPMTNMDVRAWAKKSRSPSGNWVHLTQQASVALDVILVSPSPSPSPS